MVVTKNILFNYNEYFLNGNFLKLNPALNVKKSKIGVIPLDFENIDVRVRKYTKKGKGKREREGERKFYKFLTQ